MYIRIAALTAALLATPAAISHAQQMGGAASTGTPNNIIEVPALPAATAAAPKERVICRRDVEIGSLVKGVRRCGTVSEWRESDRAAREMTDRIQSDKGRYCGPGQGSC